MRNMTQETAPQSTEIALGEMTRILLPGHDRHFLRQSVNSAISFNGIHGATVNAR